MRLPNFKRLYEIDYDEQFKPLISKLANSLNIGIETLYDALNKKITLKDNISCTVKDITVELNSSGIPKSNVSFTLDTVSSRVIGITVLRAENNTNSNVYPSSAPFITYQQNTNTIIITHISGLQADNQYTLSVVAYT